MAENEQKLAMATQLIEQAKEALQNPCEQRKSRMINTAVMLAMRTSTEVIEKVDKLDERVEALETALEDKMSKGDAEETLQRAAAAAQKAQRQAQQEALRGVKQMDCRLKKLEAQVARGTKRVAPSGACGASGSGPGTTEPKPKRERHEYDAKKYIFTSAGGQQMTMAEAQFDDIKELYLALVKAAKEDRGIKGNLTLTPGNLETWRIAVKEERLPRNPNAGRYIYLSTFLKEGKEKAAQALLAAGEVEAVGIIN